MAEQVASKPVTGPALRLGRARAGVGLISPIAWRNLWRNRRRTWLSVGAVAFATALVQFAMSFQVGSYAANIETATAFFVGHVQIQQREYIDKARFEHTIDSATPLMRSLEKRPDVLSVAPRVQAFALASVDERSFGVQVLGVDAQRERRTVKFLDRIAEGRMAQGPEEVVIGDALARNLGAALGDEVVVLGAGKTGGVAALAAQVVGIMRTGIAEFDRSLMVAPIGAVQGAFGLGDEVHTLAVRSADLLRSGALAAALNAKLPEGALARSWEQSLPEVKQGIELDKLGSVFIYAIVILVVTFSVVNSFIMTVFERTREFGMLRAIGMRPSALLGMVQLEALCVWLLGVGIALVVQAPLITWLGASGIYMGADMAALAEGMYLPERLYPVLSWAVLLTAPLVMLAGVQLAALVPALKIRRLNPVNALRAE